MGHKSLMREEVIGAYGKISYSLREETGSDSLPGGPERALHTAGMIKPKVQWRHQMFEKPEP